MSTQAECPLTDRERILTTVIRGLQSTAVLRPHASVYDQASYGDKVHFAYYRKPVKGDLVIGNTGRIDQWNIAFYEGCNDPANELHVVRDINTGQLCNYGNESFIPIVGLQPAEMMVGNERRLFEKVLAAFARGRGNEYLYRYGGFKIDGTRCTITIREAYGGFGQGSVPFDVSMDWTPRTTVKAVLQAMRDGGYGTKSFRPEAAA